MTPVILLIRLFAIFLLLHFSSLYCFAEEQSTIQVEAGETGYQIPIEIFNRDATPITGLEIVTTPSSDGLINIHFKNDPPDTISGNSSRSVVLLFDVDKTAENEALIDLNIAFKTKTGALINPRKTIKLVVKSDIKPQFPLVYRLVKAETSERGDLQEHYSRQVDQKEIGGEYGFESSTWGKHSYSVRYGFTKVPLTIHLGEPFAFEAKARFSANYSADHFCHPSRSASLSRDGKRQCATQHQQLHFRDRHSGEYIRLDESGETNILIQYGLKECYLYTADKEKYNCQDPEGIARLKSGDYTIVNYIYQSLANIVGFRPGTLAFSQSATTSVDKDGFVMSEEKSSDEQSYSFILRSELISTLLKYAPVKLAEPYLTSITGFTFPESSSAIAETTDTPPVAQEKKDETTTASTTRPKNSEPVKSSTSLEEQPKTLTEKNAPAEKEKKAEEEIKQKPSVIAIPNLAGMKSEEAMKQLQEKGLHVAIITGEPALTPAQSDTVLTQQPLPGTEINQGSTVTITRFADPLPATPAPEYRVPDVIGMREGDAKDILLKLGYKVSIQTSTREPTQAQALTVESSDPKAGQILEKGKPITLSLYGKYRKPVQILLPNVIGLKAEEARVILDDLGFEVVTKQGEQALSPEQEQTVKQVIPSVGSPLDKGASVTITAYADYIDPNLKVVEIPNVLGERTRTAMRQLREAGFKVKKINGEKAPSMKTAFTVSHINPIAGSRIAEGEVVTITILTEPERLILPDLTGMAGEKAKQQLEGMGYEVEILTGKTTTDPKQSLTVRKMNPSPGRAWAIGKHVTLNLYGEYKEPVTPDEPNWSNGCNLNGVNSGGATALWVLRDPIPYTGRGLICSDRDNAKWLSYDYRYWGRVLDIQMGAVIKGSNCYKDPKVTTKKRSYGGREICKY